MTNPGTAIGTVAYISPEQARGERLDPRTDLFSLGLVLYEMATGRPAFTGATAAVIFEAILNKTPTSPAHLNPELPLKLEEIIEKTLEKDRELRCQSARELRADLRRLTRGVEGGERATERSVPAVVKSFPHEASIVVLPFQNLSPEIDQDYFSDGLTAEVITDLSQVRTLLVISRSSAMTFKCGRKSASRSSWKASGGSGSGRAQGSRELPPSPTEWSQGLPLLRRDEANDPGKGGMLAGQVFEETQQSPRCDPVALNGDHGPGQRPTRLEPLSDVGLGALIGCHPDVSVLGAVGQDHRIERPLAQLADIDEPDQFPSCAADCLDVASGPVFVSQDPEAAGH